MIVPHGVRLTGSHEDVPVRIVSTRPSESRIRCTPGSLGPPSLQAMRWVGVESFGHSAIMSMFVPAFAAAVTTRTRRLWATVASAVGSDCAVGWSILSVDEAATGPTTPNRRPEKARSA